MFGPRQGLETESPPVYTAGRGANCIGLPSTFCAGSTLTPLEKTEETWQLEARTFPEDEPPESRTRAQRPDPGKAAW